MTLKQKDKAENKKIKSEIKESKGKRHNLLNKLIFSLAIMCGIFYVVTINDISVKGFVLEDLKATAKELNRANKSIELKVMELESFDNIARRAEQMKMVKVDKIDYITVNSEGVAMK